VVLGDIVGSTSQVVVAPSKPGTPA